MSSLGAAAAHERALVEDDARTLGATVQEDGWPCEWCKGEGVEHRVRSSAPTGGPVTRPHSCRRCGGGRKEPCDMCTTADAVAETSEGARLCASCLSMVVGDVRDITPCTCLFSITGHDHNCPVHGRKGEAL